MTALSFDDRAYGFVSYRLMAMIIRLLLYKMQKHSLSAPR